MAQRFIELIIGRLVTDEEFREAFLSDPRSALTELVARGVDLTETEMTALMATNSGLWEHVASLVDPRLQKANLKS